jgi:F1F0 ATPase subunit 2
MMIRRPTMNEMTSLILALLAGSLLGAIFFGGLWWTIRRGFSSRSPAVLYLGSLLLRTLVAVAGFYLVSRGDWRRLLACMLGFLATRIMATRIARPPSAKGVIVAEGGPS